MKRKLHTRIIAGLMLFIFAFSITPKLFLHDMFAGHTDHVSVKSSNNSLQISTAGYNCEKDGLVATSPFLADEAAPLFHAVSYSSFYQQRDISFISFEKIFSVLRGPPPVNII